MLTLCGWSIEWCIRLADIYLAVTPAQPQYAWILGCWIGCFSLSSCGSEYSGHLC